MSERKKSNLIAWIWFTAASGLLVFCAIAFPLVCIELDHKFGSSTVTALLVGCSFMAYSIITWMMRRAKSYEEDDSSAEPPVEPPAPKSLDEKRNARLSNVVFFAGFVLQLGPSLWNDFAASPLPGETMDFCLWAGFTFILMGWLLGRRSDRKWPFNPLATNQDAPQST
ncbi:MAG: hypothetical protein EXS05_20455 [Planctomycetaceae bacterium]|nr:hypothetical protein [Planctomycetaceae bacterium]